MKKSVDSHALSATSGIVVECGTYRFGGVAQLLVSALIASGMAVVGALAIFGRAIRAEAWSIIPLVVASNLLWLPLARMFRVREVPRNLALVFGALSPLAGMIVLVAPVVMLDITYIVRFYFQSLPVGLLTGVLIHYVASNEKRT